MLNKMSKYRYSYGRTPAKQVPEEPWQICKGGMWLHQSGKTNEYCEKLFSSPKGREVYAENTCSRGMMGAKIDYSAIISPPISNANWENSIKCNKN